TRTPRGQKPRRRLHAPAGCRLPKVVRFSCAVLSRSSRLAPMRSASRDELVRAHVAARTGGPRVALEIGRRRAGTGSRVDARGGWRQMNEVVRQQRIGVDVAAEVVEGDGAGAGYDA